MMAEPKPGDRFEVALTGSPGRLSLPAVLGPDGFAIEQIEDAEGRPLESALDPVESFAYRAQADQDRLSPGRDLVAGISLTGPIPIDRRAGIVTFDQRRAGHRPGCSDRFRPG